MKLLAHIYSSIQTCIIPLKPVQIELIEYTYYCAMWNPDTNVIYAAYTCWCAANPTKYSYFMRSVPAAARS